MINRNNGKVAVIMSVYGSDDPIALTGAIDSILNQSYPCDLYIFRDGEVPVALQNILDKISDNIRIKYYHSEKNKGLAFALNKLIDRVLSGGYQFVARMDSDDISRCERIEKQVAYFNEHSNVDVCGTSCREFGASYALDEKHLPSIHEKLLNFSITRCPFIHPSVMFRSSVFADGNRYPTDTVFTEDMALWFNLLNKGYIFGNINEVLLDYRLNENTIERRKGINKAMSEVRIRTSNMFALKQFSFKNVVLIYSRLIFHIMPSSLVKIAYKSAR
ncbi:MAG: glycosyltransferase [Algicola sp.]|nr:glycosyltransferase [Algicola sp.]